MLHVIIFHSVIHLFHFIKNDKMIQGKGLNMLMIIYLQTS